MATWRAYADGRSGLLNAPTGTGKTSAIWLPVIEHLQELKQEREWKPEKKLKKIQQKNTKPDCDPDRNPELESFRKPDLKFNQWDVYAADKNHVQKSDRKYGIRVLWITPLRALARDTEQALGDMCRELDVPLRILRRTGDTSSSVRSAIDRNPPEALITTPESLHVLLSRPDHARLFRDLVTVIVDEWHELMGSKRGVLAELGLAALRALRPQLRTWGMSATIGNLHEALQVLTGYPEPRHNGPKHKSDTPSAPVLIRSKASKSIRMETVLPDDPVRFPWAGHMGLRLLWKVIPIIRKSRTTLLFTNTRSQTEIWYQAILDACPDLAGQMAIHHGSISKESREWVEEAIRSEKLSLVISTSSLDLGVDFSPVETVIQVGSPKGVARYMQRAGRSGHQPCAESRIWFVPTHGMELIEAAALHSAVKHRQIESRPLYEKPLDVLLQFLSTLAAGGGFEPDAVFQIVRSTVSYRDLDENDWKWSLEFLSSGGSALRAYPDYRKLVPVDGLFVMTDRNLVRRHRLSIGAIVDDPVLKVRYLKGGYIGTVEESFVSRMRRGDTFLFAGKWLVFVRLKDMTVYVRKAAKNKGVVSRWMGGRMQLSSQLARQIREQIGRLSRGDSTAPEAHAIQPILDVQSERSRLPGWDELLVERLKSREGYHLFFYPVEGRAVHEGLASLVSWRISQQFPVTFSMAMNDFGFELITDRPLSFDAAALQRLFDPGRLEPDLARAINASEMSKRHFRELARIAGLLFTGYPGSIKAGKHLQASSEMLYDVFRKYDPDNRLLNQTAKEVLFRHINLERIRQAAERITQMQLVLQPLEKPSPFCVPIMVDRLRGRLTSEQLEDRIRKMQEQLTRK